MRNEVIECKKSEKLFVFKRRRRNSDKEADETYNDVKYERLGLIVFIP